MQITLIDPKTLTLDEMDTIEDHYGPWAKIERTGHQLRALLWATLHRTDPEMTWEACGKLEIGAAEYSAPLPTPAGPIAISSANGSRPSATSTASRRRISGV
jgi:hypothetical protein